jgi:exosortase/archaeosortase family protein
MDTLSPQERSERMGRVRNADTKPEMFVRRMVHAMGFRYRLHVGGLPGKPDLVFPGRGKIIFVHGCFWHRHPSPACKLAHSMSAMLVGSLVVGFLFCSGVLSRAVLCLASIPLAIGVNVLRVAGTAVLADHNEAFAMGFYHLFSGWLIFLVGACLLYLLARILHATVDSD